MALAAEPTIDRVVGVDVSVRELERTQQRLDHSILVPDALREREVSLIASSLVYADRRLRGFDAVAVLEVIEHIDPASIARTSRTRGLRRRLHPRIVVVTTPNREYNALFPKPRRRRCSATSITVSKWTRAEFERWGDAAAGRHGYAVELGSIGDLHATYGAPTQMAVFRCD